MKHGRGRDNDGDMSNSENSIVVEAVAAWFRFYVTPFDEKIAELLCDDAIRLCSIGISETEITGYLIRTHVGSAFSIGNAPSSSARH
ncbi:hypothetical protein [Rhizobium grahamii]|uniref:Uncharacterized protein n=1 Tax=Rhizobium grahamii CCGE 502 TaxID=990285 RepID=S3HFF1_9HYPH|nr:hypothetical protein [Rhizobium grahamii]EPE96810.1 hypothetical protein RGCCGE502_17790 [Rhizobium grahamii CCGE 502]